MLIRLVALAASAALVSGVRGSTLHENAFIVKLTEDESTSNGILPRSHHDRFHKRALDSDLKYTVRHTFDSPGTYVGLSIRVHDDSIAGQDAESVRARIRSLPGVADVSMVFNIELPKDPNNGNSSDPFFGEARKIFSAEEAAKIAVAPKAGANLDAVLQMGGVDRLHAQGIKGKGVKIGVVDSGVDWRHPAFGSGFGKGYKIEGGYAFINDQGQAVQSPDPLATCLSGGHGTHVAGTIGMDPVNAPGGFNITGVAPEASIYMYRMFDCAGRGSSDGVIAAMLKAQEDGCDIVSMSLSVGTQTMNPEGNVLRDVVVKLREAGIAVISAAGNGASSGQYSQEMYINLANPAEHEAVLAVGSVANKEFPLVYSASDSAGSNIPYAAVWPMSSADFPDGLDVYMVSDGCSRSSWNDATEYVNSQGKLNSTVFAFSSIDTYSCRPAQASVCCGDELKPRFILGIYGQGITVPYFEDYDVPAAPRFGTAGYGSVKADDGAALLAAYDAAGGFGKYKLFFNDTTYTSGTQKAGGYPDYYSSWGPHYFDFNLKPQLAAPGGKILSTWPLGPLGGYSIISGTSMATPYAAASYALVKSVFPELSVAEITTLLQTTAKPLPWIWNSEMLAGTFQQGAGLINPYKAIMSKTRVSPGQLAIDDNVAKTEWGKANITIENKSSSPKTYTFSHVGAGLTKESLDYRESNQQPVYAKAGDLPPPTELAGGETRTFSVSVLPPESSVVDPSDRGMMSGFIKVVAGSCAAFTIPYVGAPFSRFHTDYIRFDPNPANPFPRITVNGKILTGAGSTKMNSSTEFRSTIARNQYTQIYRVDVVAANTTMEVDKYGFDRNETVEYAPSTMVPTSAFAGFPTYGNLLNLTGFVSPGTNIWPSGRGLSVKADDGTNVALGPGGYRWLVSNLRWGGDAAKLEHYDTWLGPLLEVVDGPV